MFIQTEATPNPATLKFLPGRVVLPEGTYDFRSKADAGASPLAEKLFDVPGVSAVFFGHDFVTVTKDEHGLAAHEAGNSWRHHGAVHVRAAGHECGVKAKTSKKASSFEEGDQETVATIKELLETRVRPAVAQDGGDITFKGFKEGIVYLSMRGACGRMPVFDRNASARHPESSAPLCAGS
jgi:hypothetical protein